MITEYYQPTHCWNISHLTLIYQKWAVLIICLITWRYVIPPQMVVLVFGLLVCVLWFCMRCLRSNQFEFMVLIMVSMVLIVGVSQTLFFDSCGCFQFFCSIFPVRIRERAFFFLMSLSTCWVFLW